MYVLPTNGYLYSPYAQLADALASWGKRKFFEIQATSEPREYLSCPEYIDNGWDARGYYQRPVRVVDVRYRYSKGGRWYADRLVYHPGEYEVAA